MKVQFSGHALQRLAQRATISSQKVREIFDGDYYVPVGRDKNPHVFYAAFFSALDNALYVAVIDERENIIITIYDRFEAPCALSIDAVRETEQLANRARRIQQYKIVCIAEIPKIGGGRKTKRWTVLTREGNRYPNGINDFLEDREVRQLVLRFQTNLWTHYKTTGRIFAGTAKNDITPVDISTW